LRCINRHACSSAPKPRKLRGPRGRSLRATQAVRVSSATARARDVLMPSSMAASSESWTIPLHVIMWTALLAGVVMVLAVVLMH